MAKLAVDAALSGSGLWVLECRKAEVVEGTKEVGSEGTGEVETRAHENSKCAFLLCTWYEFFTIRWKTSHRNLNHHPYS